MSSNEFEKECQRVVAEVRLARHDQRKRMYEQAKRQRKAEAAKRKNKVELKDEQ
jgi:hypothetical protein